MSDRVRIILAFLVIVVILFVWSVLNKPTVKQVPVQPRSEDTLHHTEPAGVVTRQTPLIIVDTDTVVIEKEKYRLVLASAGGSVKAFYLKDYTVNIVPDNEYLFITALNDSQVVKYEYTVYHDSVVFAYNDSQVTMRKVYAFNNPRGFALTSRIDGVTHQLLSLRAGLRITEVKNRGEDLRHFSVHVKDKKVSEIKKDIKGDFSYPGVFDWFSLRSKYFFLVINNAGQWSGVNFYKLEGDKEKEKHAWIMDSLHSAAFGCYSMGGGGNRYGAEIVGAREIDISVLLLPIKYSELAQFRNSYEQIISGGLMGPIARFILLVFNVFYTLFGNYGLSIILFALIVKAIFFPLSRKMIVSQHKMQMVQPELKKLQQKYKDDPQRLNQEMMHLYKTYKVNPFTGCLPLLIQMPIFFALYETLIKSIEFRQATFMLWITDLSLKDPYYVLPIAMGVMMLIQSLLTPIDPRQRFMVILMPLFMVYIFLNFPSGLQLYWFTYNILTLVEHIITKRGGIQ